MLRLDLMIVIASFIVSIKRDSDWKSSSLFLPDDFAQVEKTDLHFQGTLGGLENLVKGSSTYHISSFNLRN
jgi:hypothetical protein